MTGFPCDPEGSPITAAEFAQALAPFDFERNGYSATWGPDDEASNPSP